MKVELNLDLKFGHKGPIKITCVYGRPTADSTRDPIPLTVRDITLNGRMLDFTERRLIMELLGGKAAIETYLQGS
jgi:hypothetical protein